MIQWFSSSDRRLLNVFEAPITPQALRGHFRLESPCEKPLSRLWSIYRGLPSSKSVTPLAVAPWGSMFNTPFYKYVSTKLSEISFKEPVTLEACNIAALGMFLVLMAVHSVLGLNYLGCIASMPAGLLERVGWIKKCVGSSKEVKKKQIIENSIVDWQNSGTRRSISASPRGTSRAGKWVKEDG